MIDSIIIGFKDIYKNYRIFIVLEISILIFCLIAISSTLSVVSNLQTYRSTESSGKNFQAVPVSYDISSSSKVIEAVNELLQIHGKTYFQSYSLTEQFNYPVMIVIDAKSTKIKNPNHMSTVYTTIPILEDVQQNEINFPEKVTISTINLKEFDQEIYDRIPEGYDFMVIHLYTNQISKWIDTGFGDEIIEFTENIELYKNGKEGEIEKQLQDIYKNSFLDISKISSSNAENHFIYQYIYPTVLIMLINIILSLIIIYNNFFKLLVKEYTIHIISGASFRNIFVRNSVFSIMLVLIAFLTIMFLDSFTFGIAQLIGSILLITVLLLMEIILYITMKRKNILNNLKGDQ